MLRQTTQMSSTNVLADIFETLQRLETRLEGQDCRLGMIEFSINSSVASPTVGCQSPEKQLPKLPSQITPTSSPYNSIASTYEASIQKLRDRFKFLDDSQSDLNSATLQSQKYNIQSEELVFPQPDASRHSFVDSPVSKERALLFATTRKDENNDDDNDDAYTRSIYSSRPLSRFDLHIDKKIASPMLDTTHLQERLHASYGTVTATTITMDDVADVPDSESRSFTSPTNLKHKSTSSSSVSRSYSQRSWSSEKSGYSHFSANSQRPHERVEMAYLAYDNFKSSIRSSIPLRSEEKKAIQDEVWRLEDLAIPAKESSITSMASKNEGEQWNSMMNSVLIWLSSSSKARNLRRIY